jgi:hypothetical protein
MKTLVTINSSLDVLCSNDSHMYFTKRNPNCSSAPRKHHLLEIEKLDILYKKKS